MQVIICGAGRFGLLAALDLLVSGDHSVTLIDQSEMLMQYMSESYDFYCVHGDATDPDILRKANIENCDMIITATSSDTTNMFICQIAHSLFQVKHKIARLHRDTFQDKRWKGLFGDNDLPVDHIMIPEWSIMQSLIQLLNLNGAQEVVPFFDDNLLLIKVVVKAASYADGKSVQDIKKFVHKKIDNKSQSLLFDIIIAKNADKNQILTEKSILRADDVIYLLANSKLAFLIMDLLGHNQVLAEKILIMGEGEVVRLFTRWCMNTVPKINFAVLVRNRRYADKLLAEFPNIAVMMGSPFSERLLDEVKIGDFDLALAIDNHEQTNILAALSAKVIGIRRTIAIVHNPFFLKMSNLANIDLLLNPRGVILSSILRIIKAGIITQMHALYNHEAEVLEWVVNDEPTDTHHKIFHQEQNQIFVLAVFRQKQVIMPIPKDMKLKKGDKVLILIPVKSRNKLEQIIS